MSFAIDRYRTNDLSFLRLQDKATGAMVAILPAYGALLHAFEIPLAGKPFNIIDNYASKDAVEQELTISYKSAKLSPFVCRIAGGRYRYEDQELSFGRTFLDGSAIHGLLADQPFQLCGEQADDQSASVALRCQYNRADPGYPFQYDCEVRYTLHPNRVLQVQTTVLNLDERPIHLADGWHPYFILGDTIDSCELQFASGTMLEFNEQLIPTGRLLHNATFRKPRLLRGHQLDNCFVLDAHEGMPCCTLHNPQNGLTLSISTDAHYPYLQIYTPDHRKSIAIENLSGAPDCFNNGIGLRLLKPQQEATFNVWYRLSVE